jgi:hypothetical protein
MMFDLRNGRPQDASGETPSRGLNRAGFRSGDAALPAVDRTAWGWHSTIITADFLLRLLIRGSRWRAAGTGCRRLAAALMHQSALVCAGDSRANRALGVVRGFAAVEDGDCVGHENCLLLRR